MKISIRYLAFILLSVISFSGLCVQIIECEDEEGNRTFAQHCPPGSEEVGKRQYSTSTPDAGATTTASLSTTLYIVPDCDTCDQVREFLQIRDISVMEKDVSDNAELQEELKEKTGGDLRVPVLLIGAEVLSGYNRTALLQALNNAGYSEEAE